MKRVAIPCDGQRVAAHFGHAAHFVFFDTDESSRQITSAQTTEAPPPQAGLLPGWLAERGANVILASGMGARARELFVQQGIEVMLGVTAGNARQATEAFLAGRLSAGPNPCNH